MDSQLQRYALGAEIVSGVAVVITLVFLTLEIRENSAVTRALTLQAITDRVQDRFLTVVESEGFANILVKVGNSESLEDLTPQERVRYRSWFNEIIAHVADFHNQHELGTISDGDLEFRRKIFVRQLDNPLAQEVWNGASKSYEEDFVSWIQGNPD